jgi:N-acetylglucosaminyldiphosphoundecaprenol N-acetyl-beta-D-mannosaminyltransferase
MRNLCGMQAAVERVSGIPVYSGPHRAVLEAMDRNIRGDRRSSYISITNTESMYYARRLPEHREHIERAAFSLCDGIGVVIGGRLQGRRIERFNGPILMLEACEYGVAHGWRHYFYGGREGVAATLAATLEKRFPGLITAGVCCPPIRPLTETEEAETASRINDSGADIVWVGLGLLKQEAWIRRFRERLDSPWLAGVGAAFDFHAGTARWAPAWIRQIGFEWLYRLCFEPRMFVRNVNSFVFLFEAAAKGLLRPPSGLHGERDA